jgi:hypothetical protein
VRGYEKKKNSFVGSGTLVSGLSLSREVLFKINQPEINHTQLQNQPNPKIIIPNLSLHRT